MWNILKLLATVTLGILLPASVSAQGTQTTGNPESEEANPQIADLAKKAMDGSTRAQLQLANAFEFGHGVEKNLEQAFHWYRIAADRGDPIAQTYLGYLYETGGDRAPNLTEAAKWYMRAAGSGFVRAQFNLGTLFLQGSGVEKDNEAAALWIGKAADAGCPRAMEALGYLYANGMGVPRDPHRAEELNKKASKKRDSNSCSIFASYPQAKR